MKQTAQKRRLLQPRRPMSLVQEKGAMQDGSKDVAEESTLKHWFGDPLNSKGLNITWIIFEAPEDEIEEPASTTLTDSKKDVYSKATGLEIWTGESAKDGRQQGQPDLPGDGGVWEDTYLNLRLRKALIMRFQSSCNNLVSLQTQIQQSSIIQG